MKKNFILMVISIMILVAIPSGTIQQAKIQDASMVPSVPSVPRAPNSPNIKAERAKLDFNFGDIPLYFISNKGQVNQEAIFYAQTSKYTLWLTKEGLIFDHSVLRKDATDHANPPRRNRDIYQLCFRTTNKNPEMFAVEKNHLKINYFKGNDKSRWYCDIPTSKAVLYKNIYKNIDLKVYGIEKQVEYDWIIKPGGNPEDICFEYQNVKSTQIDDQGNLVIETDFNESLHKRPIGFQANDNSENAVIKEKPVPVEVKFKKTGENRYCFEVGNFNKNKELVIDPTVLTYSTYLGGKGLDEGYGIAVDSSGYTYVTGQTWSTNFPLKNQYQSDPGSEDIDAFVAKIDTTQSGSSSLIYSTYLGGLNLDCGSDIAVDSNGKVYVTGQTESTDFPTKNAYQTYQGDRDVFVVKIDTTKSGTAGLVYSTYFGGTDEDFGNGIAIDNKGNAYIAGGTFSLDFPTLNPCDATTAEDALEGFVARLDTTRSGTSSLIYSTYLGGNSSDECLDIVVDNNNCAYITGWTYSKDFPKKNQYQTYRGFSDVFVTKINTAVKGASSLVYSTYLGGSDSDYGQGIALSTSNTGYVHVTGITRSPNYPTLKSYQKHQGKEDAFVTTIDTTRTGTSSLIYSTYLGGENIDIGNGIAVDPMNGQCVYVTGVTRSSSFPILNPYQTSQGDDNEDVFVSKLDTSVAGSSSLLFSTYLGGKGKDVGNAIAVYDSRNVFVTGFTYSINFPTLNQYQKDPGDFNKDAFVTRLLLEPDKPPAIQLNRTNLDFSAVTGTTNSHTGSQSFTVSNSGGGNLNWTASTSDTWISIEPSTGTADTLVNVSVDPTGLAAGVTTGTITISDPLAENSPQTLNVTLTVREPGSTNPPFGEFSTPVDGSTVSSSIAVTGWVLDDVGVESVKIYRLEGEAPVYSVYIGDALFVEGARPDIEAAYPDYPMNYRAGWGYMMLTNFLPSGGNGTFTLQAVAVDVEGKETILGSKTIIADNAHAVKPFGAIDTPIQGGTISGNKFTNWGWVLTPQPNKIPINGSTLNVWIDGVIIGHPTYNVSRPDIEGLFTGYANSSGAGGYFNLDTTLYPNGIHIIFWTASDDAGNSDGIGSRYFSIQNSAGDHVSNVMAPVDNERELGIEKITVDNSAPVKVKKGFNRDSEAKPVYPANKGYTYIRLKELERVEIHFTSASVVKPLGLQVVPGRMKPLPVGSSLDKEKGIFYWQPGPGFVGDYRLVFLTKSSAGKWSKRNILVHIVPGSHAGNDE